MHLVASAACFKLGACMTLELLLATSTIWVESAAIPGI
jgi:hypothetical protein